jgi:hypothetical protein
MIEVCNEKSVLALASFNIAMSILGMTCSAMDIWAVLCYYILSKSCLTGGKVIMFARKRRAYTFSYR